MPKMNILYGRYMHNMLFKNCDQRSYKKL